MILVSWGKKKIEQSTRPVPNYISLAQRDGMDIHPLLRDSYCMWPKEHSVTGSVCAVLPVEEPAVSIALCLGFHYRAQTPLWLQKEPEGGACFAQ